MRAAPDSVLGLRDTALVLTGFAGAFRRSELARHSAEEDDLGDELLDAQLAEADRELGEDPFETLPEMDIIEHNILDR